MAYLISSRKSRLFLDNEMKDQIGPYLKCPMNIKNGCLSMDASLQNILVICEHLLYRFVRAGGIFKQSRQDPDYPTLNIIKKYGKLDEVGDLNWFNDDVKYRNPSNLTSGWCYLLSGTLHRFFFKEWDLYSNAQPLENGDYHWWLGDKAGNIIDLTEELYLTNNISNCRKDGYKRKPLGLSYSVKTRNMAFTVLNDLCGQPINIKLINVSNYYE